MAQSARGITALPLFAALLAVGVTRAPPPPRQNGASMSTAPEELEVPPLRYLGDAQLMQPQQPVAAAVLPSEEFAAQLDMLRRAMKVHGGIGIAAPQVGWWARVFCFGIDKVNERYPTAGSVPFSFWINPEITWVSEETNWMWEGCLSVPGMRGWVQRPSSCKLRGLDENGIDREIHLEGLPARIAQHEFDHLDGVLYPQRTPGAKFLVPQASMGDKERWAEDWPSPGSRKTAVGQLSDEG